jgi:hypothetical protein
MSEHAISQAPSPSDAPQAACPQARLLLDALQDCCHPRAERLRARLLDCHDTQNLLGLRAEVLNLLALSFGCAEAQARLRQPAPLQPVPLQ